MSAGRRAPTRALGGPASQGDRLPGAQFYHVDVPLPQRYFYERGLFPLARCEVEVAGDRTIRSIHAVDSPWDTGYAIPPLTILELSPDGRLSTRWATCSSP